MEKKSFSRSAAAVKRVREETGMSQQDFALLMGYKGNTRNIGQTISNAERGLCAFPEKKLKILEDKKHRAAIIDALVEDYREHLHKVAGLI